MCKLYAKLRHLKEKGKRAEVITIAVAVFLCFQAFCCTSLSWTKELKCLSVDSANQKQVSCCRGCPGLCLLALLLNTKLSFKLQLNICWRLGPDPFLMSSSHEGASLNLDNSFLSISKSRTEICGTVSKDLLDLSIKQTGLLKLFSCF